MALDFHNGSPIHQGGVGVMPGAFNPPTIAHIELAVEAKRQHQLDQVVFLLPRTFPHKRYQDAGLDQRLAMLQAAVRDKPLFAVASSDGGLFIEIARECRDICGLGVEIFILCGRDAAERAADWDYGDGPGLHQQLDEFQMLVASRGGAYQTPQEYTGRIHGIEMPPALDGVSASAVREAIRSGGAWQASVPAGVREQIIAQHLYR